MQQHFTMKNTKLLKVNPTALGTKLEALVVLRELCGSEACLYHEEHEGLEINTDTASNTENQSFAFLHALHG